MSDNIGTARADLTIDTRNYELALQSAQTKTQSFSEAAQAAYKNMDAGQKLAANSLLKYIQSLERSLDTRKLFNAAERGVSHDFWVEAAQRIRAYNEAVEMAEAETRMMAAALTEATAINAQFDALTRQIETFGMSAAEVRRFDAALDGTEATIGPLLAKLEALEAEAKQLDAAFAMNKGVDSFIADLQRMERTIGLTSTELLELKAAEMGVTQQAAPLIASIKAKEAALEAERGALVQGKKWNDQYNMSQKQLEFAMRGLPAQFTDIFVSLQGGQAPLTVLLQQGGQLKDMFGGVGNAARVMGGELLRYIANPAVLATAAALGLAAAWRSFTNEQFEVEKAILKTNNAVGTSAGEIENLANVIGMLEGVSMGDASDSLVAVAGSGRIAAESFVAVSYAAANMAAATGASVDDTVKKFEEIAKNPVDALLRLNETEHFLTRTQLDRVKALVDEGRETEAAAEATRLYADELNRTADAAREAMPALETGWRAITGEITDAWHELGKFVDLLLTPTGEGSEGSLLAMLNGNFGPSANIRKLTGAVRGTAVRTGLLDPEVQFAGIYANGASGEQSINSAAEKRAMEQKRESDREWAQVSQRNINERQRQIMEEMDIVRMAGVLGKTEAETQAALADSRRKFAESQSRKSRRGGSGEGDAQREALEAFKGRLEIENKLLQGQTIDAQQQYELRVISAESYYSRLTEIAEAEYAAFERATAGQIAYLESQGDSAKNRYAVAQLENELAEKRIETDNKILKISGDQQKYNQRRTEALNDYTKALDAQETALMRQQQATLASLGLSEREAQLVAQVTALYTKQADELARLEDQKLRGDLSGWDFDARVQALRESTATQVQIVQDGYVQMTAAQGDWRSAWYSSVANLRDDANNIAQNTRDVFASTTSGIVSMLQEAAREGKISTDSIAQSLSDLLIQFGTNKMLAWIMSMYGGGGAGMYTGNGTGPGSMYQFGNMWAKGGVPDSPNISAFSNTVVDQPTFFAKGGNVMGEAGPEAIMPLSKDSQGRLGVSAMGGGGGTQAITLNVYGAKGEPTVQTSTDAQGGMNIDLMFDMVEQHIGRNISQGASPVGTAMKRRFAITER